MRVAVIDLGTNTFNLLVKEMSSGELLHNSKIGVKLGQGGIDENKIAPAAFERGLVALEDHLKTINSLAVDATYAFATSAIRSADNGDEFVKQASEKTGVVINVIDGQKEAELIYLGVKQALQMGPGTSLIVDIGGGSTEFILANQNEVLWKNSYNIGSSRLLEKFRPADPIYPAEIEQIEGFLTDQLQDLFTAMKKYPTRTLIGSSGSFDTLAAMVNEAYPGGHYNPLDTSYLFQLYQYQGIAQKMMRCNIEQRLATPGMIAMRADMIVMACIQVNLLIKRLGIQTLKLSTYALKEGVFHTLKDENQWQKSLL